jgi:hypothetical protein
VRPPHPGKQARTLIEECEAFLSGRYVELCEFRGDAVPVWAWLNLLAHGTDDDLRTVAAQRASADRWRQARTFLAGELLDLVDLAGAGGPSLPLLQRDALVPFELDLISCPGASAWQPRILVSGLLGVLPGKPGRRSR